MTMTSKPLTLTSVSSSIDKPVTAIVIVTVTSSVNDYSKERQFKALSDSKEVPEVKVLRDGKKYKM